MLLLIGLGILLTSLPSFASSPNSNPLKWPDMILFNGKVVTTDKHFHIHEAVAIRDGKFMAVGKNKHIQGLAGPSTQMIDLQGKTVLPGLIDSHSHIEGLGLKSLQVDFASAKTVADVLALIKAWAEKTKPGEWIRGFQFHPLSQLQEQRYITRWELDSVAPNNPVYLDTVHSSNCNSYALNLAGITKDTPNPPGGVIVKDPVTGEPNGTLLETASSLVTRLLPPWTFDEQVKARKTAMAIYNSAGYTSVVLGSADPVSFDAYKLLWANNEMTIRASLNYRPVSEKSASLEEYEDAIKRDTKLGLLDFGDEWLNFAAIKMGADGGMTIRTAYLRDPYPDDPNYYGIPVIDSEKLNKLVAICNRYGWRVVVHAVGDAAIDMVLDAYENANNEKSIVGRRFIVLHASLMLPEQMERGKRLGVRVDIQNAFMWDKAVSVEKFLGIERANRACPQRWCIDIMGIESCGGGIDYPSNIFFSPFLTMYIMVTRKDPRGLVYGADQAITREEAVRLYTNGSAHYTFDEDVKGSIEPGKLADLVVISDDILTCPEESIKDIKALMTIVGGKIFYQDPGF